MHPALTGFCKSSIINQSERRMLELIQLKTEHMNIHRGRECVRSPKIKGISRDICGIRLERTVQANGIKHKKYRGDKKSPRTIKVTDKRMVVGYGEALFPKKFLNECL